jgi:hypothetical protein
MVEEEEVKAGRKTDLLIRTDCLAFALFGSLGNHGKVILKLRNFNTL